MNEKQNNNLPEKEAVTQQVIEELSELLQKLIDNASYESIKNRIEAFFKTGAEQFDSTFNESIDGELRRLRDSDADFSETMSEIDRITNAYGSILYKTFLVLFKSGIIERYNVISNEAEEELKLTSES